MILTFLFQSCLLRIVVIVMITVLKKDLIVFTPDMCFLVSFNYGLFKTHILSFVFILNVFTLLVSVASTILFPSSTTEHE